MEGVGKVLTRGSSITICPAGRESLLNSIKRCQRKAYLRQGFSLFLLNVITSLPCSVEILSKILMTVSSDSALEKTVRGSHAFIYLPFDLGDFPPPAQRGSCPSVCSQLDCFVPKTVNKNSQFSQKVWSCIFQQQSMNLFIQQIFTEHLPSDGSW